MHIKEYRLKKGLTQAQLAQMVGCRREQISRWERGVHVPYILTVEKIAVALDVYCKDLWGEDLLGEDN